MKIGTVGVIVLFLMLLSVPSLAVPDTPQIVGPGDQTIEQDETGNITWAITSNGPNMYSIFRNSSIVDNGSFQSNETINITINSSRLGIWNYTIIVNDSSGNTSSDQVNITVNDTISPMISGPDNVTIPQYWKGKITWSIIEKNPERYWVLQTVETVVPPTPYENDSMIIVDIKNTSEVGVFNYTFIANDTSGNRNSDNVTITILKDTGPPVITGPDNHVIEQDSIWNITWNIIEENPDTYVIMKDSSPFPPDAYPKDYHNNSSIIISIDTSQTGIFNYTIIANDTRGFISSHQVNLTIQERSPPNITTDAKELVVYQDNDRKIIWKIVDLSPSRYWVRLNEKQTIIFPTPYHNGDVIEVLINTTTLGAWNYTITANDTFGNISSDQVNITVQKRPSVPTYRSGGGRGGGTSGETFTNIMVSETEREYVNKDSKVSYQFDSDGNMVRYINFTGLINAGKISVKVEILKATSSLVGHPPPDVVYKNLNIWVGKTGWAASKNIANPTIRFMVEKSWILENNVNESTITMNRYVDGRWVPLRTYWTGSNAHYLDFESETPGFSAFAITGKKIEMKAIAGGKGIIPKGSVLEDITKATGEIPGINPTPPVVTWTGLWKERVPGFQVLTALVALIALVIIGRKRDSA